MFSVRPMAAFWYEPQPSARHHFDECFRMGMRDKRVVAAQDQQGWHRTILQAQRQQSLRPELASHYPLSHQANERRGRTGRVSIPVIKIDIPL